MPDILKRVHKWMGLALLLPFVVWTVTGLLFAFKPGWGPAYEYLTPWNPANGAEGVMNLASFSGKYANDDVVAIELQSSVIGPVYKVKRDGEAPGASLYNASSGQRLDPLSTENAQALVLDAVSRSSTPERYGQIKSQDPSDKNLRVVFTGGPRVEIDLHSASIRQKGPDTDRINWYYKLHYMQWTGNQSIDRVLGFVAIVLVWLLAALGLVLAWRSRRSS